MRLGTQYSKITVKLRNVAGALNHVGTAATVTAATSAHPAKSRHQREDKTAFAADAWAVARFVEARSAVTGVGPKIDAIHNGEQPEGRDAEIKRSAGAAAGLFPIVQHLGDDFGGAVGHGVEVDGEIVLPGTEPSTGEFTRIDSTGGLVADVGHEAAEGPCAHFCAAFRTARVPGAQRVLDHGEIGDEEAFLPEGRAIQDIVDRQSDDVCINAANDDVGAIDVCDEDEVGHGNVRENFAAWNQDDIRHAFENGNRDRVGIRQHICYADLGKDRNGAGIHQHVGNANYVRGGLARFRNDDVPADNVADGWCEIIQHHDVRFAFEDHLSLGANHIRGRPGDDLHAVDVRDETQWVRRQVGETDCPHSFHRNGLHQHLEAFDIGHSPRLAVADDARFADNIGHVGIGEADYVCPAIDVRHETVVQPHEDVAQGNDRYQIDIRGTNGFDSFRHSTE